MANEKKVTMKLSPATLMLAAALSNPAPSAQAAAEHLPEKMNETETAAKLDRDAFVLYLQGLGAEPIC